MTKRRLSEMEVVEIDAIDLGDWERNMATSEVPAAHLAPLVRQTKAAPVVGEGQARRVVEKPRPTSPDVASASARPSVAPSTITPASEALPEPEPAEPANLRSRFASPRVLLLAGGALAVVILVVVLAVHGSGSTAANAEPVVASASPSPSAAPVPPTPRIADAPTPPKAHAPSHKIAPDATASAAPSSSKPIAPDATTSAAPSSSKPLDAPAKPAKPASTHHSHSSHHHASRKTVAARSAPHAEAPVDAGAVDRARDAYNAGNEALFAGSSDDAIRSYKEAIDVSPALAFGYRGLGLAYTQKGDNAAAIAAFREYLRLAPHAKDVALIRKRISGLQTHR